MLKEFLPPGKGTQAAVYRNRHRHHKEGEGGRMFESLAEESHIKWGMHTAKTGTEKEEEKKKHTQVMTAHRF